MLQIVLGRRILGIHAFEKTTVFALSNRDWRIRLNVDEPAKAVISIVVPLFDY